MRRVDYAVPARCGRGAGRRGGKRRGRDLRSLRDDVDNAVDDGNHFARLGAVEQFDDAG